MGCTTSNPEARKMLKVPTLFGGLHITVNDFHLNEGSVNLETFNPYVKIIISNQFKSTKIVEKAGFDTTYNEQCVFAINSLYKPYGRSMEIFILTRNENTTDKLMAYGLVDLDYVLKKMYKPQNMKVKLNNECSEIGFINLFVDFVEEKVESVCFRFETVDITKKPNPEGTLNCWVKTTIGEEVMETPKCQVTPKNPASWGDQCYQFEIPPCVKRAKFQIMDDKKLVGRAEVDIELFLKQTNQQAYIEKIMTEQGELSGVFYFSVIKGGDAVFKDKKEVPELTEEEKKEALRKEEETVYQEGPEPEPPILEEEKKIQYPHQLQREEGGIDLP